MVINTQPATPTCNLSWAYSQFVNPICGEHEINMLNVAIDGGTADYKYEFTFNNPGWYIVGGNTGTFNSEGDYTFAFHAESGEPAEPVTISLTITDYNGCVTTCEYIMESCAAENYCSYTKGFYGNEGGKGCGHDGYGAGAYEIMHYVMSSVGEQALFGLPANGWNLYLSDITSGNIFKMLPGGSTSSSFKLINNLPIGEFDNRSSWQKVPLSTNKNTLGSIQNNLFSQAIAFFFNLEANSFVNNDGVTMGFKAMPVTGKYLITADAVNCGEELAAAGTNIYTVIPQSVIDFLNNPANGYVESEEDIATTEDLLKLANDMLGGGIFDVHYILVTNGKKTSTVWNITHSDVTKALDAFNIGFDECRILVRQFDELPDFVTPILQEKSVAVEEQFKPAFEISDLNVYPNPFIDRLHFEFVSPENANARIDMYDMTGRMIQTVFEGPVEGGVIYNAEFKSNTIITGMYMYRMTLGEEVFIFRKE